VIGLGQGWYLVRWPYRRRYCDYLWMPGTSRWRMIATWRHNIAYWVKQHVPFGLRRIKA
jgi:hypothetical protein